MRVPRISLALIRATTLGPRFRGLRLHTLW